MSVAFAHKKVGMDAMLTTPGALLLQFGFLMLGIAVVAPKLSHVRLLIGAAALAWLVAAILVRDPVNMGWSAVLLALCLVMSGRGLWSNTMVRFSEDEKQMYDRLFSELPRNRARHLFDQGIWLTGKEGDTLTYEGALVSHLYYLAEGEARVLSQGQQVGLCHPGDLIGELTVLSGENASATVILTTPARFWCAPAEDLRPYVEAHEDVRRALEHGFATVLKAKLRASNRAMVEAHGGAAPEA
ncbi:MAG TPA: cyclic nucleotide-binding domain-containing protein [Allosphingosinicella sp.]|nr:cyclic nucleotide-binding domain-containing protein [Allosphingosinicella sp.]